MKRKALEANAEKRVEERKKKIIEEYQNLRKKGYCKSPEPEEPESNVKDQPLPANKYQSDNESHLSLYSTCISDSELIDNDQQVDEYIDRLSKLNDQKEYNSTEVSGINEQFKNLDKEKSKSEDEVDDLDKLKKELLKKQIYSFFNLYIKEIKKRYLY